MSCKRREEIVAATIESVHQRRIKHMMRVGKQLSNIKNISLEGKGGKIPIILAL